MCEGFFSSLSFFSKSVFEEIWTREDIVNMLRKKFRFFFALENAKIAEV